MMVIGLTGGIGTGKSTAAAYLREKGLAHIDADGISRELTEKGSPMLPLIDSIFGPKGRMGDGSTEVVGTDGSLDRKALASMVFSDMKKKEMLEEIMFDAIIEEIDFQIQESERAGTYGAAILDAPLLFEAGLETMCDKVILLVADETVRIERVCARDGVTSRDVRNRINSQLSDEEKIKRADMVVDNSGSEKELYEKLDMCMRKLLENPPAAADEAGDAGRQSLPQAGKKA